MYQYSLEKYKKALRAYIYRKKFRQCVVIKGFFGGMDLNSYTLNHGCAVDIINAKHCISPTACRCISSLRKRYNLRLMRCNNGLPLLMISSPNGLMICHRFRNG